MTIYHTSGTRIGYIEESAFGTLPTSPTLQPITATSLVTRGFEANNISLSVLGSATPLYILRGLQEPFIEVEFYLQNSTLPALIEDPTKSYSLVVLDDTGSSIYRILEGCRAGGLEISARVGETNLCRMAFVGKSLRDESSITGASWASEWSDTPLAWYNTRIELLKAITGESPSGSGTGPYTAVNNPFADRDEDGNIDDTGDITAYDDGSPVGVASVDSSAGTFNLSGSPAGSVTVDYVYEDPLDYLIEARFRVEYNMGRIANISQTGYQARAIREGAIEVTGDLIYTVEDSDIIDAILADTTYWGLQMKFGAGENGTMRFRLKDNFQFNSLDSPSETDTFLTGRVPISANNYNIF